MLLMGTCSCRTLCQWLPSSIACSGFALIQACLLTVQLAPVAQEPLAPTFAPVVAPSNTASANTKAPTGNRASTMKAVASAANKAAGKLKGTAPSSGAMPAQATKAAEGGSGAKQSAPQKAKPQGSALKPAATSATAGELQLNVYTFEHDLLYYFKQHVACKLNNITFLVYALQWRAATMMKHISA